MFNAEMDGYDCLVTINRHGKRWWTVNLEGTCVQISAALEELAARIAADADTTKADEWARVEYGGEAYWPDGNPLHFFEGKLPIRALPHDLRVHAEWIRHFVATGHYQPIIPYERP